MAGTTENIGNFNIEVSVTGGDKVKTDLEKIRAGLKGLKDEFDKTAKAGKQLKDALTGLKGLKLSGGVGGGSGGGSSASGKSQSIGSLFAAFAKGAKRASDSATLLSDALKKAVKDFGGASRAANKFASAAAAAADLKRSTSANTVAFKKHTPVVISDTQALRTHGKSVSRLSKWTDKAIGEEILDPSGSGTGRYTGIRGLGQVADEARVTYGKTQREANVLYVAFKKLVGESTVTRDPVTGAVTNVSRTGSKDLIHSFDALSKAAKGAAKNLNIIARGKGKGADKAEEKSLFEKMLSELKGGNKKYDAMANLMKYSNVFGSQMLGTLASGFSTFGRFAASVTTPLGALLVTASGILKLVEFEVSEMKKGEELLGGDAAKYYKIKALGLDTDRISEVAGLVYDQYVTPRGNESTGDAVKRAKKESERDAIAAFERVADMRADLARFGNVQYITGARALMMNGGGEEDLKDPLSLAKGYARASRGADKYTISTLRREAIANLGEPLANLAISGYLDKRTSEIGWAKNVFFQGLSENVLTKGVEFQRDFADSTRNQLEAIAESEFSQRRSADSTWNKMIVEYGGGLRKALARTVDSVKSVYLPKSKYRKETDSLKSPDDEKYMGMIDDGFFNPSSVLGINGFIHGERSVPSHSNVGEGGGRKLWNWFMNGDFFDLFSGEFLKRLDGYTDTVDAPKKRTEEKPVAPSESDGKKDISNDHSSANGARETLFRDAAVNVYVYGDDSPNKVVNALTKFFEDRSMTASSNANYILA